MSERIAFIAENLEDPAELLSDPQDIWLSGRFCVHVEDESVPGGYEPGPDDVPIEEAVAWARARATKVIVRVEESFFSAGSEPIVDDEGRVPVWPSGFRPERRRPSNHAFMDRTDADPPIPWTALFGLRVAFGREPAVVGDALAERLAETVDGVELRMYEPGSPDVLRIRFTVSGSTRDRARDQARAAVAGALDQVLALFGLPRQSSPGRRFDWDLEAIVVYPARSDLARINCALEESEYWTEDG